jgi:hypothetical protein
MRLLISLAIICGVAVGDGLPLVFLPNAGQFDPAVQYVVQTPDVRAAFLSDGPAFQSGGSQLRVRFSGSAPNARVEGIKKFSGSANFFIGDDPQR